MKRVSLEMVAFERRETCKTEKSKYPIVGLEHLDPENVLLTKWEKEADNTFSKVFYTNDILFGRRRAYLKKAAIAPFNGICSGDITVITAKKELILPEFLIFIIQNDSFFEFAMKNSAGSLSPRVKWEDLKEYEFYLPEYEDQKRMTEILWAMHETKEAYINLLSCTNNLLKAQFVEMFGTSEKPRSDIEYKKLGDIASYINGYAFKPDDWGQKGLPIIRIQNLTGSGEEYNYYDGTYPESVEINKGDVLISWSASLGIYLWEKEKALLNQHIFKVVFNKLPIDKQFFMYAVEQKLDEMSDKTHGSTMKHIVKKDFDNIRIAYPSADLQKEFGKLVEQSNTSKRNIQESLNNLGNMIKAMIRTTLVTNEEES